MTLARRGLLAAAGTLALPAAAQSRWQFATAYPDGNFHTRNNRQFAQEVQAATENRVAIQMHTGASLLPMPQLKRAAQTAQVQLAEVLISAYGNEDPFFEVECIPQLTVNFDEAKRLVELAKPYMEARFARQGLTALYTVPWPSNGFYTNFPVDSLEALRGTRMRTFNVMTNRLATLIGATPTLVQLVEVPQAFATGVVNAMITSAPTGVDTQAWDYVRHFTPVGLMFSRNVVVANRRALEALGAADQARIRDLAAEAEARGWTASREAERSTTAMLIERGVRVATPTPALLEGLRDVNRIITQEWVNRAGEEGRRLIEAYKAGGCAGCG